LGSCVSLHFYGDNDLVGIYKSRNINSFKMNKIEENRLILNEELSISDHVLKVTDKIYNTIMTNPTNQKYVLDNFDFIGHLVITCNEVFYQNGGATGRSHGDTATLNNNKQLISSMEIEGSFRKDINYNMDSEMNYIKGAIQHEVEHLYQAHCKLLNKNQHTIDNYYRAGVEGQKNPNVLIRLVSHIYYATDCEQDAFVNAMYQSLIKTNSTDSKVLFEQVQDTQAGILLAILKNAYRTFSNNKIQLDYNYHNMIQWLSQPQRNIEFNLEKTLKICDFRIKRLESKIGKVLTKVKKDRRMLFSEVCLNLDKTLLERVNELVNI
jgi:hypothetical protein